MIEELAHGDFRRRRIHFVRQVGEDFSNRGVECELLSIDQLTDQKRRHRLRIRPEMNQIRRKKRVVRAHLLMTKPGDNVRRVYFYGFHNDNPKQLFRSSLSLDRVLENPMGEYPVIVVFKCNGKPITVKAGGPVRMIVPECYGNRNIKYLNTIILSANYRGNDSYAGGTGGGNDTESPMKSCAYSITVAPTSPAGKPIAICGRAQVGTSGLSKLQYLISPVDQPPTSDDPWLTQRAWTDAEIAPPPETWGGRLPNGKLPEIPLQFDTKSGLPLTWPLRYTVCLWGRSRQVSSLEAIKYTQGRLTVMEIAQPLPRPVDKFSSSGQNDLRSAPILVT